MSWTWLLLALLSLALFTVGAVLAFVVALTLTLTVGATLAVILSVSVFHVAIPVTILWGSRAVSVAAVGAVTVTTIVVAIAVIVVTAATWWRSRAAAAWAALTALTAASSTTAVAFTRVEAPAGRWWRASPLQDVSSCGSVCGR